MIGLLAAKKLKLIGQSLSRPILPVPQARMNPLALDACFALAK